MLKIYCDKSGYVKWLKDYNVELVHFPYEGKSKKLNDDLIPSGPTWDELNVSWEDMKYSWNDMEESDKYSSIEAILKSNQGEDIIRDSKHLDCAYKNKCDVFLTQDRNFIKKRDKLEILLGIKIFDSDKEIDLIKKYIETTIS